MERVSGSVPLYTLIHRRNDLSFPFYSLSLNSYSYSYS